MPRFLESSIRRKITASIIATSIIALVISSFAVIAFYYVSYKVRMTDDLFIKADIAAINTTSAILFDDQDAAEQTLAALKADNDIVAAYIYDTDGVIFAEYHREEFIPSPFSTKLTGKGFSFQGNKLGVWNDIEIDGAAVGKIYLESELSELYRHFKKYLIIVALITLISALVSYILASKFQSAVSRPIMDLAETMKAVSSKKDYAIRIAENSSDELGQLIRGFNEMLVQIEQRDEALETHREKLEEEVEARTIELSRTNKNLEKLIEELKTAKRNAELANLAKSDFLANMSHELRTPLNHIIGFTELIAEKHFGELNETQEEYLNDVLNSSRHLLALINDILDLSKVEAGKLEVIYGPVDLKRVLENSLVMVKEKAIKHGLKLSCDFGTLPDIIEADERKLKQILYNLLSNAVKFTPNGGNVVLSAREMNPAGSNVEIETDDGKKTISKWVCITVKDNGIGLKQEDLKRIFNPFEQVESSKNRKYQGTGLGLSLVKNLADLHGGEIWAESEGENMGSAFTLKLPVTPHAKNMD